jgi:hypothetical protein
MFFLRGWGREEESCLKGRYSELPKGVTMGIKLMIPISKEKRERFDMNSKAVSFQLKRFFIK